MQIKKIISNLLNLIFPPVCAFCGNINEKFLCDKCENVFKQEKISQIDDYKNQPVFFDEHFYLFKYQKDVRDYIIKYKFDEKSYFYKSFSELFIRDDVFKTQFISNYDIIIAVPIHKKRFKVRGYNQSELIAKEIAEMCNIDYGRRVLRKSKNIVAQSSLEDKLDRVKNIKNAFISDLNIGLVANKRVAVFDDVFTTGATVNECAKVLKEIGANEVGIFTIAKS